MEVIVCLNDLKESTLKLLELELEKLSILDFKPYIRQAIADSHRATFRFGNYEKTLKDRP